MTLELDVLTAEQVETAREWRNRSLVGLRTPFPLTPKMQLEFYDQVISNRTAPHRYWAVMALVNPQRRHRVLVGMVGLTNVQWENGLAEISLIIDPDRDGLGYGSDAVDLVLEQAFARLRLYTVCGECYEINPAVDFWKKVVMRYRGDLAVLPRRKFWNGHLHDALYFSLSVERWREVQAERMLREVTDTGVSTP